MQSICIFAGSKLGKHLEYQESANALGKLIANKGLRLIYGGSKTGLMGAVANAVLKEGGQVIGVMPKGLFSGETVHNGLSQLIEVESMHERKAKMSELADSYIALPGGLGTFEELFEVLCWAQIGIHQKPIGLLNVKGYYDPLIQLVTYSAEEGFSGDAHMGIIQTSNNPDQLLQKLETYSPPVMETKWKS
ncbi:TIGR00730 family Rossman fold protein [Aquibacillus koreensis]|uniref:Cytokinin riboside 5'-monophosphate phosphoribohydrolase n=1 Tax=Aquibacillus koreensis TaxID=279446 RepID=A0A9X4AL72_9BACI|nr:TIGR00730 family Rossman fold protein [Aquibacillus koreensis]MCT2536201.1 TIGR00730 family Rossman fold protein [Aquibacillus koreensis]MDC3422125.1 TIGR00730 family Rossman fold protein [Aquibacillus koreensis]